MLLPLLALLLLGCSDAPPVDEDPEGAWAEIVLRSAPPRRNLMEACEWALVTAGFPPGARDEQRNNVISGWDMRLHPFSNQGRRWQGVFKLLPQEDGSFRVRARVVTERNIEVNDTLNPAAAEWEPIADDASRARILLQHLDTQLRGSR